MHAQKCASYNAVYRFGSLSDSIIISQIGDLTETLEKIDTVRSEVINIQ